MTRIIYALAQDIYCQIMKLDISKYSATIINIFQAYTNYTLFPRQLNDTINSKIPFHSSQNSMICHWKEVVCRRKVCIE